MADREREVQIFETVAELQHAAAQVVAEQLRAAGERREMHLALSGGSTPKHLHELLAGEQGIVWPRVHVYFGDERTVPPGHEQSNYRMARDTLLTRVPIPIGNIHRMRGELDPRTAADIYEREMAASFGVEPPRFPQLDVTILGVGADGHTASLFPGTRALEEREHWVVANEVPQQRTWRITLTYPVLNSACLTLFLVTGSEKADAVRRVFDPNETDKPPAAFVQPSDGRVVWYLDRAAAAGVSSRE